MIQYSGSTLINRTFTPSTRADWVNNVTQAVSDAGWTNISGTVGSGSDVLMETAANNVGAKCRVRFFDPGSGNCAQITLKNIAGTLASNIAYSLPSAGSGVWRVIANKFTFYVFPTGNTNLTVARSFVFAGTLWTPTFLPLVSGDTVGWIANSGINDTDATTRGSWRVQISALSGGPPWYAGIWQGNLAQGQAPSTATGDISITHWQGGNADGSHDGGFRWLDGTLPVTEPFVGWATGTGINNENKLKGQLYDAIVVNGACTGESTITFDGHTWLSLTNGPTAGVCAMAGLYLAVT